VQSQRFPFKVFRNDVDFTVQMDCGNRVYRARTMPATTLRTMARICRVFRDRFIGETGEAAPTDNLPAYPHSREVATAEIPGVSDVMLAVSRTPSGKAEWSVAFYDAGDESAPALLLIEEQIEQFIDRVAALTGPDNSGEPEHDTDESPRTAP